MKGAPTAWPLWAELLSAWTSGLLTGIMLSAVLYRLQFGVWP